MVKELSLTSGILPGNLHKNSKRKCERCMKTVLSTIVFKNLVPRFLILHDRLYEKTCPLKKRTDYTVEGKSFAAYHGLHPLVKTNDNQEEKSALVERELASSAGRLLYD
ncbi:hypothetical protein DAPPUDRAFT_94740 [Daphnia pulex]|uniref:Uncharacterized protein n=1 Tax=Daphnia pulex TaxID=6669 RepID=E9FSW6_DAPPU|nr:hypothetical protein DAPPUDRAFT_94740 [Daphnia pulex]|eukprot:EFX89265.1 hypothetical protein DAPPUDRAFT_94740 [Daphnia pulex]